jgi:hypothetical protein
MHDLSASDYCTLPPRLDFENFSATIVCCDIVLDSIGKPGADLDFGFDPVGTASLNAFGRPLQHNATGPPLTDPNVYSCDHRAATFCKPGRKLRFFLSPFVMIFPAAP